MQHRVPQGKRSPAAFLLLHVIIVSEQQSLLQVALGAAVKIAEAV